MNRNKKNGFLSSQAAGSSSFLSRSIHSFPKGRILAGIRVFVLSSLIIGVFSPAKIYAQQDEESIDFNSINWAFAAAFGTGVYRVRDDFDVFVLRIQPRWVKEISWKRYFGERPLLLELRFPIAFGVQNYHFEGIVGEFLDLRFRQVSFAPGAAVELPMSQRWALRITGHFGWGTETSRDRNSSWLYWGGIKSRLIFPAIGLKFGLLNGLSAYGYTPNRGSSQNFSDILTGIECDIPLGKIRWQDERLFLKTHIVNQYYLDHLRFVYEFEDPPELSWAWEFGVSLGKEKSKMKLWFFRFERIGIAYAYARDARGIRIYTRSTFD